MKTRSAIRIYTAHRDDIADLTTRRPLPGPGLDQLDPFLVLNHHGPQKYPRSNNGLPFGPHPHRGFETVTFILQGTLAHHDTGGHESIIDAGGVQWMTAGCGLIHAEISPPAFKAEGGPMEMLQLWVNLPARLKMTTPAYTGVQADGIPAIPVAGGRGTLHLTSGTFDGVTGPIRSLTNVFIGMLSLSCGATAKLPAPRDRSVLLYVVSGAIRVGDTAVKHWHLVTLDDDGDIVAVEAETDAIILFGHADPIREPIVAQGPFVMNTYEEIAEAIRDYQAGKFNGKRTLASVGG